jgi:hypothetical protein
MGLKLLQTSALRVYLDLVAHISLAASFFLAILAVVVALSSLGSLLLRLNIDVPFVAYALQLFQYFLLAIDVIVFLSSVIAETTRTIRRLQRFGNGS